MHAPHAAKAKRLNKEGGWGGGGGFVNTAFPSQVTTKTHSPAGNQDTGLVTTHSH